MAQSGSKLVVYGALAGNTGIAVIKFVAAAITGSAAMLAEGIHSTVDTCDSLLLLLGIHRSNKPADEDHPFGHGKELYFWTFVVAVLIFGVGGGVSILEGVDHIRHPQPVEDVVWSYAVLAVAAVFESITWFIALREFMHTSKPDESAWEALHTSKDPTVFTVLFEDSAALTGIAVAFLGIYLSRALDTPALDGVASVIIGAILAAVAIYLAYESKNLLVGESADPDMVRDIRRMVEADSAVERAAKPMTMHLAPDQVLLNLDVRFRRGLTISELEKVVDRLETVIRQRHPQIQRIFIETEALRSGGTSRT